MIADALGLSFGAFVLLGGVIGFLKSNSVASLISGLAFGALIAVTSQFAARNSKGYNLVPAAVCLALFLLMGSRFLASKKFMPAGMVSLFSLLMAARYFARYL